MGSQHRRYLVLRDGTKQLIEEYLSEVIQSIATASMHAWQAVRALQLVSATECPSVTVAEKLSFFNETRHSYGRSALMFSGGASLGMYHCGVIKVRSIAAPAAKSPGTSGDQPHAKGHIRRVCRFSDRRNRRWLCSLFYLMFCQAPTQMPSCWICSQMGTST